jgi:hypothetical protein
MLTNLLKCAIFLLLSVTSFADDGKFTFVERGGICPFDGMLLNEDAVAEVLANDEFLKQKCELDKKFELNKQETEFKLKIEQLQITFDSQKERDKAVIEAKTKEIEKLNDIIKKKPGRNAVAWAIIGGFAAGAAGTVAIVYAVNQ